MTLKTRMLGDSGSPVVPCFPRATKLVRCSMPQSWPDEPSAANIGTEQMECSVGKGSQCCAWYLKNLCFQKAHGWPLFNVGLCETLTTIFVNIHDQMKDRNWLTPLFTQDARSNARCIESCDATELYSHTQSANVALRVLCGPGVRCTVVSAARHIWSYMEIIWRKYECENLGQITDAEQNGGFFVHPSRVLRFTGISADIVRRHTIYCQDRTQFVNRTWHRKILKHREIKMGMLFGFSCMEIAAWVSIVCNCSMSHRPQECSTQCTCGCWRGRRVDHCEAIHTLTSPLPGPCTRCMLTAADDQPAGADPNPTERHLLKCPSVRCLQCNLVWPWPHSCNS